MTPETARLLQHWRHHNSSNIRLFFCRVEAAKTAIRLTEVAPQFGKSTERFVKHLANANLSLNRRALKLATGAGKTTVMRMIDDKAHHYYRERPKAASDANDGDLPSDDKKEAEQSSEATRLRISGIEAVQRKIGVTCVIDLGRRQLSIRK